MSTKKNWSGKTGVMKCIGRTKINYSELKEYLGTEHFIEDDPFRTHSGVERFWIFEVLEGVALAFRYHDMTEELFVGLNKPLIDPCEIILEFIPVPLEEEYGEMWQ